MKLKLQKNNTLTKTIKKANFKPTKFKKIAKKTWDVLFISNSILIVTNFFDITNLEKVENVLSKIVSVLFGYLIVSKAKQLIDTAVSNAKLELLCNQLLTSYDIKVSSIYLKSVDVYSKDGVNLILLDDKSSILEVSNDSGTPEYSYYVDGEYTNISEVVNNVVLTMRQKRRNNKKTAHNYDNQCNKEDYKDMRGFLD